MSSEEVMWDWRVQLSFSLGLAWLRQVSENGVYRTTPTEKQKPH